MSGIVFYKTTQLNNLRDFYTNMVQANVWLDQGKCIVLQHGNFLLGFCAGNDVDKCGIITFFYRTAGEVNQMYQKLHSVAEASPRINMEYRIYHFFARDPEGRRIEFQTFLHRLEEHWTGSELLLQRRSIRSFTEESVSEELLHKVFERCRYAPTSRNCESYYYVITNDNKKIATLAAIRDRASSPLADAPLVVAVCSDSSKSSRPQQDACIAAYHFLLAAAQYGLGTCWITDMDRSEVKSILNIPLEDYVACLTPLGFYEIADMQTTEDELRKCSDTSELPQRRDVKELFRFV